MRFLASLFALTFFTLAGCPSAEPRLCPPDGTGFHEGTGLYCAYGVVIGGFRECPRGLPNRFDFPDGSFVCSDRAIGSAADIPASVCLHLPACDMPIVDTCVTTLVAGQPCSFTASCETHVCPDCCEWNHWACEDGVVTITLRQVRDCGLNDAFFRRPDAFDAPPDSGADTSELDASEVDAE